MKRFWKEATVAPIDGGYRILLDGRPVRTPGKNPLSLPSEALASAVAREWNEADDETDPAAMPLTGFANAAIDLVSARRAAFAADIAAFAASDLLCYRTEAPDALIARQRAAWDPVVRWAESRLDARVLLAECVMPIEQPDAFLAAVRRFFAARTPFELAALDVVTRISGSAILTLALAEGAIDPEQAFAASVIDELWQEEFWGEDHEAVRDRGARQRQFYDACRFLALAQGVS